MSQPFKDFAQYEHRFWLQILGDHARFMLLSLAVKEQNEIQQANRYLAEFDHLLSIIQTDTTSIDLGNFNKQVIDKVKQFKSFKIHLIRRHLAENLGMNLSPSLLSHMINELEEYESMLRYMVGEKVPPAAHPLHYHHLWLLDGIGHAASIASALDMSERELREEAEQFEKDFGRYFDKAQELIGYLRTNLLSFPALTRFNQEANQLMVQFISFLNDLKALSLRNEILGSTDPLLFDHMLREECYYLKKISQVSEIQPPKCDPTSPRVQK